MKCPRCNGNGSVPYPIDYEQGLFDETNCPLCGGSGETMRTIKEIALELLDKYAEAQRGIIWEYSGDIDGSTKALEEEVKEYENEIKRSE